MPRTKLFGSSPLLSANNDEPSSGRILVGGAISVLGCGFASRPGDVPMTAEKIVLEFRFVLSR